MLGAVVTVRWLRYADGWGAPRVVAGQGGYSETGQEGKGALLIEQTAAKGERKGCDRAGIRSRKSWMGDGAGYGHGALFE